MITLYTFGDSMLDCARYNREGVHPGALLVRNDDARFPEYRGRDLASRFGSGEVRLEARAVDGATVSGLSRQARGVKGDGHAIALLTIGGNDLLGGLVADDGEGIRRFAASLEETLAALPIRPVLVGTVYDPTFGDDARSFVGVDPKVARRNLARMNETLRAIGERHGSVVDVHAHFLGGDPSWFVSVIEPSLRGASEMRAAFLPSVMAWADRLTAQ